MPRKPTSIYLIVEHPASTIQALPPMGAPMPATSLQAWRIPILDGEEPEDAAKRGYEAHPIGSTITFVEDTKVQAYTVGLTLTEVDDPRIDEEERD